MNVADDQPRQRQPTVLATGNGQRRWLRRDAMRASEAHRDDAGEEAVVLGDAEGAARYKVCALATKARLPSTHPAVTTAVSVRLALKRYRRVGGNLEQDVAEEEDAGGGAVCGVALRRRSAFIARAATERAGPINEADHIQHASAGNSWRAACPGHCAWGLPRLHLRPFRGLSNNRS